MSKKRHKKNRAQKKLKAQLNIQQKQKISPPETVKNSPVEIVSKLTTPVNPSGKTPASSAPLQNTSTIKRKTLIDRLENYLLLMRVDRPIGILLLLWPTYWALWLAAGGFPSAKNILIFTWGCILMRSAGCVINDYADRNFDGKVKRTRDRMIVAGKVSPREALILFAVICLLAFGLVLLTNPLTIKLSFAGLVLAAAYPFSKRFTHMPQVVLGAAFAWSIPMAWAAQSDAATLSALGSKIWLVYLAVVLWAVVYDTFYAMVDRHDDIKAGIKSTAILFGDADRVITGFLQALMIVTLVLIGLKFALGIYYYSSLGIAAALFVYQQRLIRDRKPENCFKAFLNNNYVGLAVFAGVALDFYF